MARNVNPPPGSIRSIQRGVASGDASITISSINPSRALVTINGGNYGDDDGGTATGACPVVQSLSATNLSISNATYKDVSVVRNASVSWQIVEYY